MSEKTCPICGKPTNIYMGNARKDGLCREHGKLANTGDLIKCPICFTWKMYNEECETCKLEEIKAKKKKAEKTSSSWNKTNTGNEKQEKVTTEDLDTNELTCIICGNISNGKHFCYDCYKNYKDKSIDIRITNCKEIKILDQYGNLTIECDDGRKVRSRAEALISNFFYNNKIRSVYERTIYYEEDGENKTLHPDFYLPDYELYIEYNEIKKKSYLKSKEYTMSIYKKLGFKVIIMDDQDLNSIAGFLKPILRIN